jgi:hypothetical protein
MKFLFCFIALVHSVSFNINFPDYYERYFSKTNLETHTTTYLNTSTLHAINVNCDLLNDFLLCIIYRPDFTSVQSYDLHKDKWSMIRKFSHVNSGEFYASKLYMITNFNELQICNLETCNKAFKLPGYYLNIYICYLDYTKLIIRFNFLFHRYLQINFHCMTIYNATTCSACILPVTMESCSPKYRKLSAVWNNRKL